MSERTNDPADRVRQLQRQLYVTAKRSRRRRFHALFDRICRGDVLAEAWERVKANKGAAGIDGETLSMIEQGGVRLDGAVVSDKALKVGAGTMVVQVGKRKFARVTLTGGA